MNYWEEKIFFWKNKTDGNDIYKKQKNEVASDLKEIIKREKIKRVIDVGGYDGIVGTLLPDGIEYINLDIKHGVDITSEWNKQKTLETLKKVKGTLIFTSLTLICIPPERMHELLREIRKYGDTFYFYEEKFNPEKYRDGQQLSEEYGGKWIYDWKRLLAWGFWKTEESKVNPSWIRIWSRIR